MPVYKSVTIPTILDTKQTDVLNKKYGKAVNTAKIKRIKQLKKKK